MDSKAWAEKIYREISEKEHEVALRNVDKIPYTANGGVFDDWSDKNICWWTNGFWAGLLWQLYAQTHDETFRITAEKIEQKLDTNLMLAWGMDHDSGFKWLLTAAANYKLTGNTASRNRMLLAANDLAGRLNLNGRFLRAWNDNGDGTNAGQAIIDCMMNLPLLYLASNETRDPRFRQIAECHADTAAKVFVRDDGSVNHIVVFDPESGEMIKTLGGQGLGEGSCWTRGQAWALYGFTLSYLHTKKELYLQTARRAADYFTSHIPESGLIPVDFCQDPDCEWEDSTAAAIAACGLIELSAACGETSYKETAIRLLKTLSELRFDRSLSTDNLLEKCSVAYHDKEHNFPIIYGDYFFTEAILKLCERETFLW